MKDFLIFLPLTIVYLAFKGALFPVIPLPDIPLIIVFYAAYTKPSYEGALLGFVLGVVEDSLSAGILGTTSFSLVMVFLAVHLLSMKMHFTTPLIKAVAAGSLTILKGALIYTVLSFTNFASAFPLRVVLQAFVTGALAPAVITLIARLLSLVNRNTFKDSNIS
ncbi:MAG: rod shape-determining protein MreD [Deltaproteobacteria bacterium]|nr:rod shape-determining protein MreD [Deltaproteobacteria bacterium]MBI5810628.1 rod shape-determining protein MreD [Deltaproteobacteria bacterium]